MFTYLWVLGGSVVSIVVGPMSVGMVEGEVKFTFSGVVTGNGGRDGK